LLFNGSSPGRLCWPEDGLPTDHRLQIPASRARVLDAPSGSLADYGLPGLSYLAAFGHSPGHLALLHGPSRTLLAAGERAVHQEVCMTTY
jgi:glyoxylase-like metal-dependent hydrolase (beta-lactamase superfamily II)